MTITIINDCQDANATARQTARVSVLLKSPAHLIGVANDLEASGNLIDVLDAIDGHDGVILANVAPRNGDSKKWGNGAPFGYFWYNKILVIASIAGLTLSLVKKLGLAETIFLLDSSHVRSQFRSFDFLPYAAFQTLNQTLNQKPLPSKTISIAEIPDPPRAVWWVDNFGNCKTTLLREDSLPTSVPFVEHLKDVPDGAAAIVVGSSGIGKRRFLEIVVQGDSAAHTLGISSGDAVV